MKFIVRISLLPLLLCLFILPVHAQRRSGKPATKASSASGPRTICQGDDLPKGFVIVEARRSSKCIELIVKKPAATEIVCDGSPIPDGYSVMKQDSSPQCSAVSANPLTNALLISNDGSTVASALKARARRNDDGNDEEVERPRPSSASERAKTLVEQRAEEEQRKARLANAVNDHQIQVGMTKAQLLESWGKPSRVWIEITPRGRSDVWAYSGDNGSTNVYFDSGIVSNFRYSN